VTTAVVSRPAPSFLPATAVLEMTYRCNHACLFCSCPWYCARGDFEVREELTVADWRPVIERLCSLGVCNLAFTGGEPLLKEGLSALIEHAAACTAEHIETEHGRLVSRFEPPNLYLLSNGKAMNSDILRLCRDRIWLVGCHRTRRRLSRFDLSHEDRLQRQEAQIIGNRRKRVKINNFRQLYRTRPLPSSLA